MDRAEASTSFLLDQPAGRSPSGLSGGLDGGDCGGAKQSESAMGASWRSEKREEPPDGYLFRGEQLVQE